MTGATLDQFVRHAQKFGTDFVFETAAESGLGEAELMHLGEQLATIASQRTQRRRSRGRR